MIKTKCTHCQNPVLRNISQFSRSKNHFCSRQCAGVFNRTGVPSNNKLKERICELCNSIYIFSSTYKDTRKCQNCKLAFYVNRGKEQKILRDLHQAGEL